MVSKKTTPFPMTVHENIAFGIRLQHEVSKLEMDELVEERCVVRLCRMRSKTISIGVALTCLAAGSSV
jgi:phosphate transport system ATP-binding protein